VKFHKQTEFSNKKEASLTKALRCFDMASPQEHSSHREEPFVKKDISMKKRLPFCHVQMTFRTALSFFITQLKIPYLLFSLPSV
jgi:hypothetical protein